MFSFLFLFCFFFCLTQPPQSPGQTVIENGEIKMQAELSKLSSQSVLMPTLTRKEKKKNKQGGLRGLQLPNRWVGIKIGCVLGALLILAKRNACISA